MYDVQLDFSQFPPQADRGITDTTIGQILRDRATLAPQALAVAEPDLDNRGALGRSLTYAKLLAEAERLARALLTRFRPGERIAIWAPNSIEWAIFEFAASLAGMTFVTINPSSQAREVHYVLVQSRASALFTIDSYRGNSMWAIASEVVSQLPSVRELVKLDDPMRLFAGGEEHMSLPEVAPQSAAMIIYTSGTTGAPKGVILTHRGATNNARLLYDRLAPPSGRAVVTAVPLFHVGGCVGSMLGALQQGCPLILLRMFDPSLILSLVEKQRAGTVTGVPTMIFALLEAQEAGARDVSSLERVLCGGSVIAPELVRRVRDILGCGLQNIYGQTEVSGVLTQTFLDDAIDDIVETVGQPLPMTELSIRSLDTGEALPIDQVGEICARGYCTMLRYNDNPEATATAFHAGDWLRTGDLGVMDQRGFVRVTGRVKEMIIRGGENIYPAEIENILLEHPDVAEVAVVGIPDPRWGEIVGCFVRVAPGGSFNEEALAKHCRDHISPQKTPSKWVEVTSWPLTGSGKIQKFALRDMLIEAD